MKDSPTVTSILITYNHEKSVAKALESMLKQQTDFGHIIHIEDDCSTDRTTQICIEYAECYPDRIKFTPKQRNLGIVGNIYHGVSKIGSEFYAMLEGDDYWCDENKLQKQVDALRANPSCSFCGHNTLRVDQEDQERPLFTSRKHNIRKQYQFPKHYKKRDFVKVHPSSRLFRTAFLDLDNLKFKDSVVWDSSSYWYFLSKGNLLYIDEIMSVYHYNGQGVFSSASKTKQNYMSILNTMNINEEFKFKYNAIFISRLFRYKKLLNLTLLTRLRLKHNIHENRALYNEVRNRAKTFLES